MGRVVQWLIVINRSIWSPWQLTSAYAGGRIMFTSLMSLFPGFFLQAKAYLIIIHRISVVITDNR